MSFGLHACKKTNVSILQCVARFNRELIEETVALETKYIIYTSTWKIVVLIPVHINTRKVLTLVYVNTI